MRELKELRPKYESVSFELEFLRSRAKVEDEDCESCLVVMGELTELQTLHAQVASWLETTGKKLLEESRPTLLGGYKNCPLLSKDTDVKDKRIKDL